MTTRTSVPSLGADCRDERPRSSCTKIRKQLARRLGCRGMRELVVRIGDTEGFELTSLFQCPDPNDLDTVHGFWHPWRSTRGRQASSHARSRRALLTRVVRLVCFDPAEVTEQAISEVRQNDHALVMKTVFHLVE